jgi:hypothetical protein
MWARRERCFLELPRSIASGCCRKRIRKSLTPPWQL